MISRCIIALLLLVTSSANAQRKFSFIKSKHVNVPFDTIWVRPQNYQVFVRRICSTNGAAPSGCPVVLPAGTRLIETEYLLRDTATNRVVYITNYPDQFEDLLGSPVFEISNGIIPINPWYFSKVFVGTYDHVQRRIRFTKNAREVLEVLFTDSGNNIQFEELHFTGGPALVAANSVAPLRFELQPTFQWRFSNNGPAATPVLLSVDAILVSRQSKSRGIYFLLSNQWKDRNCCYIRFKKSHIYSLVY